MTRVLTCLARLLAALTFLALPASAQDSGDDAADPAMLVADAVYVEADSRLVAKIGRAHV